MANDFRERPGNRGEFSGPVGQFVGPAEPSGFVALPFGRHAKAKSVRRFGLRGWLHPEKEFNTESAESREKGALFFAQPTVQDWRGRGDGGWPPKHAKECGGLHFWSVSDQRGGVCVVVCG